MFEKFETRKGFICVHREKMVWWSDNDRDGNSAHQSKRWERLALKQILSTNTSSIDIRSITLIIFVDHYTHCLCWPLILVDIHCQTWIERNCSLLDNEPVQIIPLSPKCFRVSKCIPRRICWWLPVMDKNSLIILGVCLGLIAPAVMIMSLMLCIRNSGWCGHCYGLGPTPPPPWNGCCQWWSSSSGCGSTKILVWIMEVAATQPESSK